MKFSLNLNGTNYSISQIESLESSLSTQKVYYQAEYSLVDRTELEDSRIALSETKTYLEMVRSGKDTFEDLDTEESVLNDIFELEVEIKKIATTIDNLIFKFRRIKEADKVIELLKGNKGIMELWRPTE